MENRPIDQTDREILAALANNARLSNKELAARVGLAPSSCHERVRRLVHDGAILGFHAAVNPAVLGFGIEAMLAVRLPQHSRQNFDAFRAYVATIPEVVDVYHVSGEIDFLVHVVARDAQHLRDLALDRFLSRPEVGHIETELIFDHVRPPAHA
ncbi:MAG: Lrp/AsnC family transcriptional regulator [Gemmatimonadota bacterium]|nr:Lrp/AsnC family transcriptional regulator [Gemmatimonadota bacterium]HEU4988667.1 Lrp/AsnC family transcriptional regulator [Gemmatimonadaceae bacterium]